MPTVRGCNLPDDLLYDVENHTWFTEVGDGTVRIGMTTIATAMAGQLVAFAAALIPMMYTGLRLTRIEGGILVAGYCSYMIWLILG